MEQHCAAGWVPTYNGTELDKTTVTYGGKCEFLPIVLILIKRIYSRIVLLFGIFSLHRLKLSVYRFQKTEYIESLLDLENMEITESNMVKFRRSQFLSLLPCKAQKYDFGDIPLQKNYQN